VSRFAQLLLYAPRVGRLRGIPVHLHLSFLLLALYLLLTTKALWVDLVLVLVVFTSVLLHELGHCEGARKVGGLPQRIVLWPLGGLAYNSHEDTAKAELIVSAAGPLVNLVLALIAGGILLVRPDVPGLDQVRAGASTLLTDLVALVATVNALLFVFNVLPAFPLDGGSIARALLRFPLQWKRATLVVGGLGVATAGALIVLGIQWRAGILFGLGLLFLFVSGSEFRKAWRFTPLPEYDDLMPHERRAGS